MWYQEVREVSREGVIWSYVHFKNTIVPAVWKMDKAAVMKRIKDQSRVHLGEGQ